MRRVVVGVETPRVARTLTRGAPPVQVNSITPDGGVQGKEARAFRPLAAPSTLMQCS